DENQKEAYEIQLENKLARNELPLDVDWFIVADPPGAKIGNGGSTLVALETLHKKFGDDLFNLRVMINHAGGWSQRMPSASILGKIFTTVPHGNPIYQMLDVNLAWYWPFVKKMTAGVLVACADVLLTFNLNCHDDWKVSDSGFTALAHPSPMKLGNTHGVYVVKEPNKINSAKHIVKAECLEVLQKPSDERMLEASAIFAESGVHTFADGCTVNGKCVYTDSSFFFGADVVRKLLELKKELGVLTCEIDAYGDFLQALGPRANDKYITYNSNISEITQNLTECRLKVFEKLKGTDIHILIMNASKFNHIGTTKEYLEHFCEDEIFRKEVAIESDVFNDWLNSIVPENSCVMHSSLLSSSLIQSNSVLEYCHFELPVEVGSRSILSNCQYLETSDKILKIPSNLFIHTVPVCSETLSKFVTVFFQIDDNLKKSVPMKEILKLPFMKSDLETLIKSWGIQSIQSAVNNGVCSLWTAQIFPAEDTMTESFKKSLDMIQSISASSNSSLSLKNAQLFSFSDLLKMKDVKGMIQFRESLREKICPKPNNGIS
ncbi:hypothetical protein LOTGIDRAFT_112785, partial [Lottia gigantea]